MCIIIGQPGVNTSESRGNVFLVQTGCIYIHIQVASSYYFDVFLIIFIMTLI